MKLTTFLLLVFALHLSASVYSQQIKLSIDMQGKTIKEILQIIEQQTSYRFIYENEKINLDSRVNIQVNQESVENILDELFNDKEIQYSITASKLILIKPGRNLTDSTGNQQVQKVTGKVTDSSGAPLPGVSVVIKGTTTGTITDFDGKYNLANVPADATLVFSFVGMKAQEIPMSGKSSINVTMKEETVGIEEVVAIGYGTVKKSDLTGAVGSVSGSLVADRQVTQLSQALQGAMSGVMVTRNGNSPGSPATIRIRGITTIGTSAPLVIVDGVPVDNINSVNSNDVESISVLKDAASASIYGSRAAAGVILITTKRAKPEELGLEYNFEFGMEKPTTLADHVDAVRYMQIANESGWNDVGNNANEYPVYSKDLIENYYSLNK
ncbi:MAG: carboxypeptidase-like regulatory domain-containing protein [Prolixibacteraceae bacterium]|nr:carboxypeptidase-like regulatory domain-containing protein [Prolixibacteraceae bacterium]